MAYLCEKNTDITKTKIYKDRFSYNRLSLQNVATNDIYLIEIQRSSFKGVIRFRRNQRIINLLLPWEFCRDI